MTNFNAVLAKVSLVAALFACASGAGAQQLVNLTTKIIPNNCGANNNPCVAPASTGMINQAIFQRDATQPAGTGVFNPFLRLDVKGNTADEQGYNTNAVKGDQTNNFTTRKVLDNMSPVNWTHDIKVSDLNAVNVGGVSYYQFKLDINEPGNDKSMLSLDGLRLIIGAGGQFADGLEPAGAPGTANDLIINGYNGTSGGINGTVVWDMDRSGLVGSGADYALQDTGNNKNYQDNYVMLDASVAGGPGSGVADMMFLVPVSVVNPGGINNDKNLILWSRFGLQGGMQADKTEGAFADAGFEEWSYGAKLGTVINPPGPGIGVPTPGSAALAVLGLGLLAGRRRQRLSAANRG